MPGDRYEEAARSLGCTPSFVEGVVATLVEGWAPWDLEALLAKTARDLERLLVEDPPDSGELVKAGRLWQYLTLAVDAALEARGLADVAPAAVRFDAAWRHRGG